MVLVASDGWREEGPKQTAKGILLLLYPATWVDGCVGWVCVCACLSLFCNKEYMVPVQEKQ